MSNKTKYIIVSVAGLVALLLFSVHAIRHVFKNHPYEYVYFNELSGGVDGAIGNYELDYYYHSIRECSEWIIENVEPVPGTKLKIASWHLASAQYFFRNDTANFAPVFARWYERGNFDWDYAIFSLTGIVPDELKNENFPPKNAVYTVKVDDIPIAFVLKRETKKDLEAFRYKQNKEFQKAANCAREALEIDPTNISIYATLGESFLNLQKLDSARLYMEQAREYVQSFETINYFLAFYYHRSNQNGKAIDMCNQIISDNFKFPGAYHLMFQIYAGMNDVRNAEKIMLRMLDNDQIDQQGFQQLQSVYLAKGMSEYAATKKIYQRLIKMYEKKGDEDQAKMYRDQLEGR